MDAGRRILLGCALLVAACGGEDSDAGPTPDVPAAGVATTAGTGVLPATPVAGEPVAGAPVPTGAAGLEPMAGDEAPVAGEPIAGAPVAGDATMAGSGADPVPPGAVPTAMVPDPAFTTTCPTPPAGADPQAVLALDAVNAMRLPSGSGCASMSAEINLAAQNHCDYYAQNSGACTANAHNEVDGCAGFTGENPGDRMQAAGYTGRGSTEVMAFSDDADRAVSSWINSVWHRIPLLDPWMTELGYGHAASCDTMDWGRGTPAADDVVAIYPYHGQTAIPVSFDGSREGPEPPAPPTGWPSASPVSVFATDAVITEHLLTVDGDDTPIEHMWLTSVDSNFLRRGVMMYGYAPFTPLTTYRVRVVGTYAGGPLELEWTFTTGEASRFGR